jgi:adenylate cyclase
VTESSIVESLVRLGVPAEDIQRAAEQGRPEDAIFEQVLDPERLERSVTPGEVEAAGGLTAEETQGLMKAFGLPAPGRNDPCLTPAEARVFNELGRLSELWPREVRQEVARVYGQALARIAATEVHLFRSRVEPWLREITPRPLDALAAMRQAFEWLLPLTDPMLVGVHRRQIEQQLTQAAVWEVESEADGPLPGSRPVSFLFCDLTGFTAYTNTHGDSAAIELIDRFAAMVEDSLGEHGRFVKRLGDGFMLAYPEAAESVAAAMRIAETTGDLEGVGVHAAAHHGIAVFREGDYFGRAVNLTARLLDKAKAAELLATEDVATSTPEYEWRRLGARRLRGFEEPQEIYALNLLP